MNDPDWSVLRSASDYRRMPWKNGGGETIEIAVHPQGATVADFDWRISMATVASDGPFSSFPGIDRTLSILDGDGMVLDIDGRAPVRLAAEDEPLHFPADAATSAKLIDGAITDLNVMTRRSGFSHAVQRLQVENPLPVPGGAQTRIVFCHKGGVLLTAGNAKARLSALDTAILTSSVDMLIAPRERAEIFLIEISKA